jgi:hypothetical protein
MGLMKSDSSFHGLTSNSLVCTVSYLVQEGCARWRTWRVHSVLQHPFHILKAFFVPTRTGLLWVLAVPYLGHFKDIETRTQSLLRVL